MLSTETVRSHVKNILRKLKVRSREEAVAVADEMRNTAPPIEGRREREPIDIVGRHRADARRGNPADSAARGSPPAREVQPD